MVADEQRRRQPPVASTSTRPSRDRAQEELQQLVSSFPTVQPRIAQRSTAQVQSDIATCRRACVAAHAALSSLQQHRRAAESTQTSRKGKGKATDEESAVVSPEVERKVVRLVAETMRLLLHLGHVQAAADLDRAFFTTRKPTRSEQRRRRQQQFAPRKDGAAAADEASQSSLGDGLGLPRGRNHLAWMQAVALQLQQQEQRGGGGGGASGSAPRPGEGITEAQKRKVLRGVEVSLAGAREHTGGPGPPRRTTDSAAQNRSTTPPSDLLAFAARRMGAVQQLVRSAAVPGSPKPVVTASGRASVRRLGEEIGAWLHDVKRAECERGDEMVSMALLESGLARLETALEGIERQARRGEGGRASGRGGGEVGDGPLMHKVDGDIERLVRSLETEPTSPRAVTPKQVCRHAHILALAIRFLLFRHRLAAPDRHAGSSSPSPGPGPVDPLLSASQLYAVLLKVPLPVVVTPEIVAEVRTRQTSSLFRLLDAHLTAVAAAAPPPQDHQRRTLDRTLDLLDLTMDRLRLYETATSGGLVRLDSDSHAEGEEDPLLRRSLRLGVSAQTYQRLLRHLAEPFRPRSSSRPSHPASHQFHHHHHHHQHHHRSQQGPSRHPTVQPPSFAALSRALDVIARCRAHDRRFLPSASATPTTPNVAPPPSSTVGGGNVFCHPKTTIHFVRAWFAAPTRTLAPQHSPPPPPPPFPTDSTPPVASSTAATAGGSEIAYRLESLLTFVDAIDDAQPPPPPHEPRSDDHVVAVAAAAALRSRKVVAKAVREIVEQRWGVVRRIGTSPAADAPTSPSLDAGDGNGESTGSALENAPPVRDWRDLVVETRLKDWLN